MSHWVHVIFLYAIFRWESSICLRWPTIPRLSYTGPSLEVLSSSLHPSNGYGLVSRFLGHQPGLNGYQAYEHLTGRPFPMEADILVDR
jgi:hypothetical protein